MRPALLATIIAIASAGCTEVGPPPRSHERQAESATGEAGEAATSTLGTPPATGADDVASAGRSGNESDSRAAGNAASPPFAGSNRAPSDASAAGSAGAPSSHDAAGPIAGGGPSSAPACKTDELECTGVCTPANDPKHCGRCDHDCTQLPHVLGSVSCVDGLCAYAPTACAQGFAHCAADPDTGCETDLRNPKSCGSCGALCAGATPMCAGTGGCVSGCPLATPTLCGATCTDLQTDPKNCGTCLNACTSSAPRSEPVCEAGKCDFVCKDSATKCGSTCVDTNTDNANCGACGERCSGGKSCISGSCMCPSGTHDCNGSCVSNDDVANCGMSCTPCRTSLANATATCSSGKCAFECSGAYTECSGSCVDLRSDPNHCGSCQNVCGAGQRCVSGKCDCGSGSHLCDGRCVSDMSTSSCGKSCSPCPTPTSDGGHATCDGTKCGLECTATTTLCGTACVYIEYDRNNCGSCGHSCAAGVTCTGGLCGAP